MIILSLKCDNIFMFKDFSIDFTYSRKLNHYISENDILFEDSKIKVRKNLIILGGNASGKTTFGKLLCSILNYLLGRDIDSESNLNLLKARFDKKKKASFEIEFVLEKQAYLVKASIDDKGVVCESLREVTVNKSYNITKLRKLLDESDPLESYDRRLLGTNEKDVEEEHNKYSSHIFDKGVLKGKIGFNFMFSYFAESSKSKEIKIPVSILNYVLPKIDNSVEKVLSLKASDKKVKIESFTIIFKNGEHITVPEGDLSNADKDRLSHGTYESLLFLQVLYDLKNRPRDIFYIDEKLPHIHSELESSLIMSAILRKGKDGQLFITTHNPELFNLNVPNNIFLLFKRSKSGFNDIIFASDKFTKNDRNLKNYYVNDFFGVLPDYSNLDDFFGGKIN